MPYQPLQDLGEEAFRDVHRLRDLGSVRVPVAFPRKVQHGAYGVIGFSGHQHELFQGLEDFADHLGRWFQGLISFLSPLGRTRFRGASRKMNICLELPQELIDISTQVVKIDLSIEEDAFGIDNECSSEGVARFRIVDPEETGERTRTVRTHGELHFFKHLFVTLPCKVNELGVGADSDDIGIQFFEFIVLLCQSSELGRSYEREIGGVEEEDGPSFGCLPCSKAYFIEIAL